MEAGDPKSEVRGQKGGTQGWSDLPFAGGGGGFGVEPIKGAIDEY